MPNSLQINRWSVSVAAVVAICVAAGANAAQSNLTFGQNMAPPGGALVAPGEPPSLSMLFTGAVTGYIDVCG